jgi:hypothetical protein
MFHTLHKISLKGHTESRLRVRSDYGVLAFNRLRTSGSILRKYYAVKLEIKCMVKGNWICLHPRMSVSAYTMESLLYYKDISQPLGVSSARCYVGTDLLIILFFMNVLLWESVEVCAVCKTITWNRDLNWINNVPPILLQDVKTLSVMKRQHEN